MSVLRFCTRYISIAPPTCRRTASSFAGAQYIKSSSLDQNKNALADTVDAVTEPESGHDSSKQQTPSMVSRGILKPWVLNKAYDPQDFIQERRLEVLKPLKRRGVGPGAAESTYDDIFLQLNINPLRESNNQTLLSWFVTKMGKIKGRNETKLSWRSQRLLTKAIKRAKHKFVMPFMYNHLIIKNQNRRVS